MSDPRKPQQPEGTFFSGLLTGAVFGILVSACVIGLIGYRYVKKKTDGWELVEVIVAARDLPAGTPISSEHIHHRMVPRKFVTGSTLVGLEHAKDFLGTPIEVPVRAGDILLKSQFDSQKVAYVLFATRDIAVGAKLTKEDVTQRRLYSNLLTPSYVEAREQSRFLGRTVSTAFRKGDPLLDTHFQDAPTPSTNAPGP